MASPDFLAALASLIASEQAKAGTVASVDVAPAPPALGHDPLAGLTPDDDGPPEVDLHGVLVALRDLAIAAAATAHLRSDLCGHQWRAVEAATVKIVGAPAPLPAPEELRDAVGSGPNVTWLRAQWEAARAKGDTALMAWFAAQGQKHGTIFQ